MQMILQKVTNVDLFRNMQIVLQKVTTSVDLFRNMQTVLQKVTSVDIDRNKLNIGEGNELKLRKMYGRNARTVEKHVVGN